MRHRAVLGSLPDGVLRNKSKAYVHEQVCQLDVRAEQTPQPEHAEPTAEPTQHSCEESNFPLTMDTVPDGDAEKGGTCFSSYAMDFFSERCV